MKLIWTRRARNNFIDILNHIEQEFGRTASDHFKIKTKEFTILLKKFPEIGTLEVRNKQIRGFQLTRQTRLFYRLKEGSIIILALFDSRQDPTKKPH